MKKAILAVGMLGVCWFASVMSAVEGGGDSASAIKALEARFAKAVQAKDLDSIMKCYVADESLFVFDVVPPRQYVGAKAYRKDWMDFLATFPGPITFEVNDLSVTASADMAYGHSAQRITGVDKNGKNIDLTVRVTDVYRRLKGKWLVVHEHVSVPVDLETAKPDFSSKL